MEGHKQKGKHRKRNVGPGDRGPRKVRVAPDHVSHLWFQVLRACDGRPYAGAVQKFLASVLPACGDLSFQQDQMTQTFGFKDPEIT